MRRFRRSWRRALRTFVLSFAVAAVLAGPASAQVGNQMPPGYAPDVEAELALIEAPSFGPIRARPSCTQAGSSRETSKGRTGVRPAQRGRRDAGGVPAERGQLVCSELGRRSTAATSRLGSASG